MSDDIILRNAREFDGHTVTTITYKGRRCWLALEVGEAIGYENGGHTFVAQITNAWASEFVEELDFCKLTGRELAEFKRLLGPSSSFELGHASHVLILFESGLNLALMKTKKPAGVQLRRFLAVEVLPQLRRPVNTFRQQRFVKSIRWKRSVFDLTKQATCALLCRHSLRKVC